MKKILTIILCLIMMFSFAPKEEVKAEGTITNITIVGEDLSWDPYPGADFYMIGVGPLAYYAGDSSNTYYYGVTDLIKDSGYEEGDYDVYLMALRDDMTLVADGWSSNTYHFTPLGRMDIPQNPRWLDDRTGTWDPVANADSYIVTVFRNGLEYDFGISYETEMDLSRFMTDPSFSYCFNVKAHRYEYEDSYESEVSPEIPAKEIHLERISGYSRYETSVNIADTVNEIRGYTPFPAAVIATGTNYPDALSGSFLANRNKAPMLMINEKYAQNVSNYIWNAVKPGGTVYVLGGEGAVKEEWLAKLKQDGYDVKRLAGKDRYETNLAILREAGIDQGTILVCTGRNYADSLSCSALDFPILLVGKSLTASQKEYLASLKKSDTWFFVIGGTGAVSAEIEVQLGNYGTVVDRIAGKDRYETSVNIARQFLSRSGKYVIATGKNFPDGLSGGPLAYALGAPLILVADGKTEKAAEYTSYPGVTVGYALGGTGALSEAVFNAVFHVMTESYQ